MNFTNSTKLQTAPKSVLWYLLHTPYAQMSTCIFISKKFLPTAIPFE